MRVITAIFLQKTMKVTGNEEELMMIGKMNEKDALIHKLREFLAESDTNGNGEMTNDELDAVLRQPNIEGWLGFIGLEPHEIVGLFAVLDDGDGIVAHSELINGIMRLSNGVRVIDTLMLMHGQKRMLNKLERVSAQVTPAQQQEKRRVFTPEASRSAIPPAEPFGHPKPCMLSRSASCVISTSN